MLESDAAVYRALVELDNRLFEMDVRPFDLKVVGGFALLLHKIRPVTEENQYTDVDYVGEDFDSQVQKVIQEVGIQFRLGKKWVNHDVMMDGLDLDDLEYATGPLHFKKQMELNVITVYVLQLEDLLRMKVIAVDTSYMAWKDFGGEFTRKKDFGDIQLLCQTLGWNMKELKMHTHDWVLNQKGVYNLIQQECHIG